MTHPNLEYIKEVEQIMPVLQAQLAPGDVVVCMGAGSIGRLAGKLIEALGEEQARPQLASHAIPV